MSENWKLPPPPETVGMDLAAALRLRRSTREYDASRTLTPESLSALLWAANGINAADGKRTAPSAFGLNQVELYLLDAGGAFRYDAPEHALVKLHGRDVRAGLCPDEWTDTGAVTLVLTGWNNRFPDFVTPAFALELLQATAGCIAENIHLMAAALGLGTCMVGHMNTGAVQQALALTAEEIPLYVMPTGYLRG